MDFNRIMEILVAFTEDKKIKITDSEKSFMLDMIKSMKKISSGLNIFCNLSLILNLIVVVINIYIGISVIPIIIIYLYTLFFKFKIIIPTIKQLDDIEKKMIKQ